MNHRYTCMVIKKIQQTQSQTLHIKHVSNRTTRFWESIKSSMCLEYLSEEIYLKIVKIQGTKMLILVQNSNKFALAI